MSASREKKSRQEQTGSGWNDPKTAREAKERKEERRTNILYGTIGVVFLLVAIAAVVWKSNIIPKSATAVTINGETYNAAEVNFYFENNYQNFLNKNYNYLSMIGLDTGSSLKSQTVSATGAMFVTDATEGETWYDYFLNGALDQMAGIQALNDAAAADGFTWTDELQADLDANMETLSSTASTYGYTEQQYLSLIYGSTMTRSIYEEQTRRSMLATAYLQDYQDSLSYTDEELEAAYEEARTTYDHVTCQFVRVNGATADTDEEGNEIEVTDEMTAEAMATAKTTADAIYAAYQAGDLDFIDSVPTDQIASLNGVDPEFYVVDNLGTYYVSFNVKSPLFDGKTVEQANAMRRAFAMLVDRQYIIDTVAQTGQLPANTFVPAGMADGHGGVFRADDDAYTYPVETGYFSTEVDVEGAIELLKSAGYEFDANNMLSASTPISFEYLTNEGSGNVGIAECIQQDLAVIGINMTIRTCEWNVFLNDRKNGNYDIARNGWLADFNDPINFLEMWTTDSGNNDCQFGR